jgi:F0F1-type ATP synthase alpha subunit
VNSEGLLDKLKVDQIRKFENMFIETMSAKYSDQMKTLANSGVLNDTFGAEVIKTAESTIDQLLAASEE